MGKLALVAVLPFLAAGATLLAAGCAAQPVPQAVAPALPPATYHQLTILEPAKTVIGLPPGPVRSCCRREHAGSPCVIDVQKALKATPEAQEFLAKGYGKDSAEYHLLLYQANERLKRAIQGVISRHGYDMVLERGSVVLKPEITDVQVADITTEVILAVSR